MRPLPLSVLLIAVLAAAGCGSGDERTPSACIAPRSAYLSYLSDAPRPVRLDGRTPISACLAKDQSAAQLAEVGRSLVATATILNASARREPRNRQAVVALGYLVGAARRGASDTGGIHTDLLRRLTAAALFSGSSATLPLSFRRAYGRGYAAGQRTG